MSIDSDHRQIKHRFCSTERVRLGTMILMLTGCLCLLAAGSTQASGPVIFGAKLGLSISDQDYDYSDAILTFDRTPRVGLALSLLAEINLSPYLSLQPELGFIQRGSDVEVTEVSETSPDRVTKRRLEDRIDYLVVPLYAKVIVPGNRYRPYFLAGPRIDMKINDDSESASILANELETLVYGGSVGIGLEYGYGPVGAVIAEFVYQFDFSDAASAEHVTVKNRSLLILLGYTF